MIRNDAKCQWPEADTARRALKSESVPRARLHLLTVTMILQWLARAFFPEPILRNGVLHR
jgi:hypothetical protein